MSNNFSDAGNDTITIGNGETYVIGGGGDDLITGLTGNQIVVGDQGDITWDTTGSLTKVASLFNANSSDGVDTITLGNGQNIVIGGGKGDVITTGSGNDYIVGDNGFATVVAGVVTQLSSADPTVTGDDLINAGQGNNTVIGGSGNDTLNTGNGNDVIIGDGGFVTWSTAGVLQQASSLFNTAGTDGNDVINPGNGANYIIGGGGNDTINGGADNDYIIGDNGSITWLAGVPSLMTSADFTVAGNDTIVTGEGDNYVIGGGGNDSIVSGSGRDQLIGDQGFVTWNADGTRHEVSSLFNPTGTDGADVISGGGGNDNIIGGQGADTLDGGDGNDIITGDDGHVVFNNDQEVMAETLDQHQGTGDIIIAGAGNNFLFGGEPNNLFFANPLTDLIAIVDGHVDISTNRQVAINIPPFFGDPILSPLGKALNIQRIDTSNLTGSSVLFTPANVDLDTNAITAVFGGGNFQNAPSLILSTLLGQQNSAFNLQGLLSDSIMGASLTGLLAIGPTSLIESVTVGDAQDPQQSTGDGGTAVADSGHHAIQGVLAGLLDGSGDHAGAAPVLTHDLVTGSDALDAPALPRPMLVDMSAQIHAGSAAAAAVEPAAVLIFDEERGLWVPDTAVTAGPRLILNGAELPSLDLSGEMTMAA